MAEINQEGTSGVFGGVSLDDQQRKQQVAGDNFLPTKVGFWNKFKSILFYEIKVELTPYEQKVEDEINNFLSQEVTWAKVKDFLFQEL